MTNNKNIIILALVLIIAIIIVYLIFSSEDESEYFTTGEVVSSTEAIENLASIYNTTGEMVVNNLSVTKKFNLLPTGMIVAFNGTTAPPGWAICDGTNGTPDLRGRFIRMWNSDDGDKANSWAYKVAPAVLHRDYGQSSIVGISRSDSRSAIYPHTFGDQGGTDHQILQAVEMPAHGHTFHIDFWGLDTGGWIGGMPNPRAAGTDHNQHPATLPYGTDNAGGNAGHNNTPPYYVLTYIMKL